MSRLGTGAEMNLALHDEFVAAHGTSLWHEVSVSCPTCRVDDVHAGSTSEPGIVRTGPWCSQCRGRGVVYADGRLIKGILSDAQYVRSISDHDRISGNMMFTPFPVSEGIRRDVSQGDKLTATTPQAVDQGQVIVRGAASMDEAAEIDSGLSPDEDMLWWEPAKAIWCMDSDGVRYHEGADFVLGPGRFIKWLQAKMNLGHRYVLKYLGFLEWIAFNPPGEPIDKDGRDLGRSVLLQRRSDVFMLDGKRVVDSDRIGIRARMNAAVLP